MVHLLPLGSFESGQWAVARLIESESGEGAPMLGDIGEGNGAEGSFGGELDGDGLMPAFGGDEMKGDKMG